MAALEIVVVAVLILLNGYLAMCELAIVSSRRSHLERLASGGHAGARAALILANDPARFLASLQIGITSVAVLTGTFSGATLAHRLDDWLDLFPAISPYSKPIAFALIVVSVTFLSLLFGELVPKQIALKNPEALAIRLARPLVAFMQHCRSAGLGTERVGQSRSACLWSKSGLRAAPYRRGHRRRFNRGGKVRTYSRRGA